MKAILIICFVFFALTAPVYANLTTQDIEKIRSIVKEEVGASEKEIKEYITQEIKTVNVKIDEMDKRLNLISNLVIALIALIIIAVGIPQIVIAWKSRKDRSVDRQIEDLKQEIEMLKQQRILNP